MCDKCEFISDDNKFIQRENVTLAFYKQRLKKNTQCAELLSNQKVSGFFSLHHPQK